VDPGVRRGDEPGIDSSDPGIQAKKKAAFAAFSSEPVAADQR